MKETTKVAALVPFHTDFCAGQRFRIELWARHLRPRGIEVEFFPFASPGLTAILHKPGRPLRKAAGVLRCYLDQLRRVLGASRPDVVYIYQQGALIGPAWIEKLTRRWKVPIVYDLDEPLFVPYVSPHNGRLSALRCISKTDDLLRMSDHTLVVNRAIAEYAQRFARRISIVPMCVDTERYRPAPQPVGEGPARIGWVGSRSTQPNLEIVAEPIRRLSRSRDCVLRVVADDPEAVPDVPVEFHPWHYDEEVPRLQECQIAVVPLKPHVWTPWKFNLKTVQCMSLGLPVVATPEGSNREIIQDGVNGFLAATDEEWHDRLQTLIDDPALRRSMGQAARETVQENFTLAGQIDVMERVFTNRSLRG